MSDSWPPPPTTGEAPAWTPPESGPDTSTPGTDAVAFAALACGILPLWPLAIIFGIVSLRRIRTSGQGGRGLGIAGIALGCVWVLVGVAALALLDGDEVRPAAELQVGDCFDTPDDGDVLEVATASCDEPHDAEAYAEFDIPGDAFPGEDQTVTAAQAGCNERFEVFVGLAPGASALRVFLLYPTAESWDEHGDRQVTCAIVDPAAQTVGSLQGVAR